MSKIRLLIRLGAVTFKCAQGPFLITAHESTVSGNVRCQYGRQPTVDLLFRHLDPLDTGEDVSQDDVDRQRMKGP